LGKADEGQFSRWHRALCHAVPFEAPLRGAELGLMVPAGPLQPQILHDHAVLTRVFTVTPKAGLPCTREEVLPAPTARLSGRMARGLEE